MKHYVFMTDKCNRCLKEVKGTYHQVGVHYDDRIEHIALCGKCFNKSIQEVAR